MKDLHTTLMKFFDEITADLVVSDEEKAALEVAGKQLSESGYGRNSLTLLAEEEVEGDNYRPSVREVKEDLEWFLTFVAA